jgi:hypothetical protein
MKWLIFLVVVVANALEVFFALAPGLVTYAGIPPEGISCRLCDVPEVKEALTAAATYGRAVIIKRLNSSALWILALGVFNITAVALLLFWQRRSNKLSEPTP